VSVFSLEMSAESLVRRMVCCHAGVPRENLSTGNVGKEEHGLLVGAMDVLAKAPIYVDDSAGLEALDLRAARRRLSASTAWNSSWSIYLQLMNFSKFAAEGRQRETAAISQALKGMAKELRCPSSC
jgi:replicative DNA helicase